MARYAIALFCVLAALTLLVSCSGSERPAAAHAASANSSDRPEPSRSFLSSSATSKWRTQAGAEAFLLLHLWRWPVTRPIANQKTHLAFTNTYSICHKRAPSTFNCLLYYMPTERSRWVHYFVDAAGAIHVRAR